MLRLLLTLLLTSTFLQANVADDYKLQQSDTIRMAVYLEPDVTTEAIIGKSGAVSFPLIGSVKLKGLSVSEAEQTIKELYEKDYLVSAKVSILVLSYAKKWVSVSGAVAAPGNIPYPEEGKITLAAAIAMAGGILENGNSSAITIGRKKGGNSTYNLTRAAKVEVNPGDTIVVPRKAQIVEKTATVTGEVRNPGPITLGPKGRLDVLTAIAKAGGYSRIANQRDAILQRRAGSGFKAGDISLKDIRAGKVAVFLYPGDILIIKESRF